MTAPAGPAAANPLAAGLARVLGAPVSGLQRLSGGASQETWAFTLAAPNAPGNTLPNAQPNTQPNAQAQRLVLRRAPAGAALRGSDNAGLAAEARLIVLAAQAGVPVPALVHALAPGDGLGDGFITAWLPGETLGRRIAAAHRPALAWQCGQALARIHALPAAALPPLRCTQPRAEVEHLRAWHAQHGTLRPVFQLALRWLADHAPADVPPVLVHGDFRNGNLMVDLQHDQLVGVLDWELAHCGDAMADLGWLAVASWRFGQSQRPVGGFGDWAELIAGYEAAGGAVDRERVRWWQLLGTLRWGVICESMGQAWLSGAEPEMEKAAIARRASETELDLLQLLAPLVPLGPELAAAPQVAAGAPLHDAPGPEQLLGAVSGWLRDDLLPTLAGAPAYQARVAANLLDTVARQLLLGPPAQAQASARLRALLCHPRATTNGPVPTRASGGPGSAADAALDAATLNAELTGQLASGGLTLATTPGLAEHLWASALDKLAIDQPGYDTLRRLQAGTPTLPTATGSHDGL